jgi:hypothetical protein
MAGAATAGDDLWLNWLTFGANAASRSDIAPLGRAGWLETQLAGQCATDDRGAGGQAGPLPAGGWRDLGALQQDVSVVVMSEFGRRLRSTTAGGTDHGRGNAMLVLGPQARGGRMLGRSPGLKNEELEEGADLAVVTDYRAVLAELLAGHMGLADPASVFPGFQPTPLGLWG